MATEKPKDRPVAVAAIIDASANSAATMKMENTEKRDSLVQWEDTIRKRWYDEKIFETNPPSIDDFPLDSITPEELQKRFPKFFGTWPYLYANGLPHLGHAFTISKAEFAAAWERLNGKNVLLPMGLHCTGMPIKAASDKLVRELEMFGNDFSKCPDLPSKVEEKVVEKDDPTKFVAKKGKAAAKAVALKWQFQIMLANGIKLEDIPKFADPLHWVEFFPKLAIRDCVNFGAHLDLRRGFVTTDYNPYYDAFTRWQMNRLKELNKIKYGLRNTIYSPKDGQACMDHDRSEGEGALPQEYVAIKLKVIKLAEAAEKQIKLPEGAKLYFVAATLRPETMYGLNAAFVSPKLTYGVYQAKDEYYVMMDRAARNMAYQGIFPENGVYPKVADLEGAAAIGTTVEAPLSWHSQIWILPMETVLATKGTGVVCSVPSDSPDDYATITDLAKKADYYKIQKEWAELEVKPIIKTPTSDLIAPFLVKKMKINSPKDVKQLAEAKEIAYKEGFYQGQMLVGDFTGEKVEVAKPKVREQLIKSGQAFIYSEPERLVVSRSGDNCVVALLSQYYLDYGEEKWYEQAVGYVRDGLNTYTDETRNAFESVLGWLHQWACARSYGLGSKLPWDHNFLVESLSDSTIYMSYYTLVPYLHKDIYGREPIDVKPEQMTDEVFDYVFCRTDSVKSDIPQKTLQAMRRSFQYFYPLDLRASGKDLINNHLTFCVYVHIALFPREYWPRSIRLNGHLQLNGQKMSKSTGNFMTLEDSLQKFGADATRLTLADAGDAVEDANFEETVANATILRLHTLRDWCKDTLKDELRSGEKNYWDLLFENELYGLLREAKTQYEATMYKLAIKAGFYDFQTARDFYREAITAAGLKMHKDVISKYIEYQALIIAPLAPHFADYLWLEILKNNETIQKAILPEIPQPNAALTAAREYVKTTFSEITSAEAAQLKKKAKGRNVTYDPKKPKRITVYTASAFPSWQQKYIDLLKEQLDKKFDDKELNGRIGKMGEMKKAMPFVQGLKKRVQQGESPAAVFERKLLFDELDTLKQMTSGIKRTTGCKEVVLILVSDGGKTGREVGETLGEEKELTAGENAIPGSPAFSFENI